MVARDILLAELTGARYHVAHISARHSVAMVGYAKLAASTLHAKLLRIISRIADSDILPYDSNYKMKPPLRSHGDIDSLSSGIADGTVDALATDHAPHAGSEKMQEFEKCPFGIIGLETAVGLTLEKLVHSGLISLRRMVELYTVGPARVLGLRQGTLSVGAPGDITIFSPSVQWTYDVNRSYSKSRNSPFDGVMFRGGAMATVVSGKVVWNRDWQ